MIQTDRETLRRALVSELPVRVTFHGQPKCAPSLPVRGCGYFAFRTWGRLFVAIWPERPLAADEHARLLALLQPWTLNEGWTIRAGVNDSWPCAEED